MSVASEISRLQTDRNTIRAKLVELGLAPTTANLTALAAAIEEIVNRGAVSITVQEGDTITIPAGYHNGSGTVSGVAGGGNYNLQSKNITPTKKQQSVTPDNGYYGLSDVTVAAIPEVYQDVSSVTAGAGDVLTGKVFVLADGTVTVGTMANNGAVSQALSATSVSYTIPKGYHNGFGKVTITLETKTVTPTKEVQEITPTAGKVLSKVTVNPIPDNYIDTTDADAAAEHILDGKTAYVDGVKVDGAMPNNSVEGATYTYLSPAIPQKKIAKGYHNGNETVMVRSTTKTVTPTKSVQAVQDNNSYFKTVTVEAIPDAYQDVTPVTANANTVLEGSVFVDKDGNAVEGSIASYGESYTIDGLTETSVIIAEGFHSGSSVSLTSDIEEALAAI